MTDADRRELKALRERDAATKRASDAAIECGRLEARLEHATRQAAILLRQRDATRAECEDLRALLRELQTKKETEKPQRATDSGCPAYRELLSDYQMALEEIQDRGKERDDLQQEVAALREHLAIAEDAARQLVAVAEERCPCLPYLSDWTELAREAKG